MHLSNRKRKPTELPQSIRTKTTQRFINHSPGPTCTPHLIRPQDISIRIIWARSHSPYLFYLNYLVHLLHLHKFISQRFLTLHPPIPPHFRQQSGQKGVLSPPVPFSVPQPNCFAHQFERPRTFNIKQIRNKTDRESHCDVILASLNSLQWLKVVSLSRVNSSLIRGKVKAAEMWDAA